MTLGEKLLKKLTTRNILALSVTGMVLATIFQFITNPDKLTVTIAQNKEFVIAGSIVFGIFLAKWSDIIQFYFKKAQSKEAQPDQ